MNCPYSTCKASTLVSTSRHCSVCQRVLKPCGQCKTFNRALATYCRECGERLGDLAGQWAGLQGGVDRRGLNPHRLSLGLQQLTPHEVQRLRLENRCLSLLFYDDYLFAISNRGEVQALDLTLKHGPVRWKPLDDVAGYPAIGHGNLYMADARRVTATQLAGLATPSRKLQLQWEAPIEAPPVHGLLPHGRRLFFTLKLPGGEQRVQMISDTWAKRMQKPETIYSGPGISSLVAVPDVRQTGAGKVYFLSQAARGGGLQVHGIAGQNGKVVHGTRDFISAPHGLQADIPITSVGKKLFAVLGERDELCRLDAEDATFDERIRHDTQSFAVAGVRDGLVVSSASLYFLQQGVEEEVQQPVSTPPVILRERIGVVGFADGRIQLHDLGHPPFFREIRVARGKSRVTALASAGSFIAAGGEDGSVVLIRMEGGSL